MRVYYITTFTEEGKLTCSYPYSQWKELIADLNEKGTKYHAWSEWLSTLF